jgi:hypothetical protein
MKYCILLATIGILFAFATTQPPTNPRPPGHADNFAHLRANTAVPALEATYSYHLEGSTVSGGKVDEVQVNNAAFVTGNGGEKKLQFFLSDGYSDKSETFAHSLRFAIPDKIGSVDIKDGDDNWSIQLFLSSGGDGKYTLYGNEAFVVTVNSISATRISGTFSGKVKDVSSPREMAITDGKFDIPIRTLGH